MADHALLSASSSAKWLVCTPSARLEETFPNESSDEASEGTKAHDLATLVGRDHFFDERSPILATLASVEEAGYNAEMLEAAQIFVAACSALVEPLREAGEPYSILIEQRLDYSPWAPEAFGTGDFVLVSKRKVWVRDFKYGKGVKVDAENNSQMMLYGLGAYNDLSFAYEDIESFDIGIVQPRIENVSSFEISTTDLVAWGNKVVQPQGTKAFAGEGEFVPGDHCRDYFCRARFTCRARAEKALSLSEGKLLGPVLSIEEIAELLPHLDEIASWAKGLASFALEQAVDNGTSFPGYKLVEGRSNRYISDQKLAAVRLVANGVPKEKLFGEPAMLGITAIEELVGKKKFAELLQDILVKPPGKPVLVPIADKRPAWQPRPDADACFGD